MTTLPLLFAIATGSTWTIDPQHAQAKFTVRHMMVMDVTGTLGRVNGTVDLNEKDITKSTIEVTIDVDPQTQEAKRDAHLKSADFFDIERFPKATFKATKIAKAGKDKFKVTGPLTLRDVTKDVTFEVTLTPEYIHPFSQAPVRAVTAKATINRLDYNLKWQVPMANNSLFVGNDVKIELGAELRPPEPPKVEEKAPSKADDKTPAKDAGSATPKK